MLSEEEKENLEQKLDNLSNLLKEINDNVYGIQLSVNSISGNDSNSSQNLELEKEMLYYYHFQNQLMQKQIINTIKKVNIEYKPISSLDFEKDSFIVEGDLDTLKQLVISKNPNIIVQEIDHNTTQSNLMKNLDIEKGSMVLFLLNSVLIDELTISNLISAVNEKTMKYFIGKGPSARDITFSFDKCQIILAIEDIRQLNRQDINFPVYSYKK